MVTSLTEWKKLLSEKAPNKRNLPNLTVYQDIYNFWLSKTINPNNSKANVVSVMISLLLQQYKFITDQNLKHKEQLCQVTRLSLWQTHFSNCTRKKIPRKFHAQFLIFANAILKHLNLSISYRTVPSSISPTFSEFLIFCRNSSKI